MFKLIGAASSGSVLVTDGSGICHFANSRHSKLTGVPNSLAIGSLWYNLVHPDERNDIAKQWGLTSAARGEFDRIVQWMRADRSNVPVRVNAVPFDSPELKDGYVITIEDLSRRTNLTEAMSRDHRLLELVSFAQRDFIAQRSREDLFRALLTGLLEVTGLEAAFIGEVSENEILPVAIAGKSGNVDQSEIDSWESKFRSVLLVRAPLLTPKLLAIPLSTQSTVRGVFALYGDRNIDDNYLIDSLKHLSITCAHLLQAYAARDAQLKSEQEFVKLAEIARRTSNAVVITDRAARIEWVNEAFERLTGYKIEELRGQRAGRVQRGRKTDPSATAMMRQAISEGRGFQCEVLNYAKDGHEYWVDIECQPIHSVNGEFTHYMAIETDITERKRQAEALRRALEQAEAATAAKAQFLANMSHEIRTPLTAIIGFAEALRDPTLSSDELTRGLESIGANGRHLLGIINDILDLSKIDAGAMKVEQVFFSPVLIVEEVRSMMEIRLAEKAVTLAIEYEWPLPEMVRSDPLRFKQVLINLMGNAIKFTERGCVTLKVSWSKEQNLLQVSVQDSGIGIDPEDLKKLFQPFSQADSGMTRRFGGTGLGLSISAHFIELMGGSIAVDSVPGKGSTFSFSVAAGDVGDMPVLTAVPERAPTPSAPGLDHRELCGKVLIADDAVENQKLIAFLLRKTGITPTFVGDGQQAVWAATSGAFDLILMDMQMPIMDGYAATRELRQHNITTPIVALTANALQQEIPKCIEAGCTTHLAKPFQNHEFFRLLQRFLKPSGARPELSMTSSRLKDDPEMLDLVRHFVSSQEGRIAEARQCLDQGNFKALAETGHRLHGSGGLYGYDRLAALGDALETAAKAREAVQLIGLIDQWAHLHGRMTEGLPSEAAADYSDEQQEQNS